MYLITLTLENSCVKNSIIHASQRKDILEHFMEANIQYQETKYFGILYLQTAMAVTNQSNYKNKDSFDNKVYIYFTF